jgi:hypothetical protein
MSMFSTKHGLYQRACKRFNISDGKKLFTWRFYDKQRTEVTSFFVDIHKEAAKAQPGVGHRAVAQLHDEGKLLRHYTMNVDGLATHVRTFVATALLSALPRTGRKLCMRRVHSGYDRARLEHRAARVRVSRLRAFGALRYVLAPLLALNQISVCSLAWVSGTKRVIQMARL